MSWLTVEELFPGMKLGQDVFNKRGVLIIAEGVELTNKHINILKTWGILEVNIVGTEEVDKESDSAKEEELGQEILRNIDDFLDKRFAQAGDSEIIKEIKRIIRRLKIDRMIKDKNKEQ